VFSAFAAQFERFCDVKRFGMLSCVWKIVKFAKFAKRIDETSTRNRDRKNEAVVWQHFNGEYVLFIEFA
jgi:hypothetical protein